MDSVSLWRLATLERFASGSCLTRSVEVTQSSQAMSHLSKNFRSDSDTSRSSRKSKPTKNISSSSLDKPTSLRSTLFKDLRLTWATDAHGGDSSVWYADLPTSEMCVPVLGAATLRNAFDTRPPCMASTQRFTAAKHKKDARSKCRNAIHPEQSLSNTRHVAASCLSVLGSAAPGDFCKSLMHMSIQSSQVARMFLALSKSRIQARKRLECWANKADFMLSSNGASGCESRYAGGFQRSKKPRSLEETKPNPVRANKSNNLFADPL
mmetsp:Transcript_676/g.1681  ORF Transcript_676/g.1681 Transcript_676/m.1681 type:complete len:266 (-) Transcript_676:566-1363(-)